MPRQPSNSATERHWVETCAVHLRDNHVVRTLVHLSHILCPLIATVGLPLHTTLATIHNGVDNYKPKGPAMSDDNNQADKKQDAVRRRRVIFTLIFSILLAAGVLAGLLSAVHGIVTHTEINNGLIGFLVGVTVFAVAFLAYLGDSGGSASEQVVRKLIVAIFSFIKGVTEVAVPFGGVELALRRANSADRINTKEQSFISDEDRARLVSDLEQKIKVAAAEDVFREGVLKEVQEIQRDSAEADRLDAINTQFNAARARLDQAIGLLHRKANINMLVGILLSALGIFFLGITVVPGLFNRFFAIPQDLLQGSENLSDPTQFWIHYLPRVTLAVVLELFAYFFLSLYKANAAETRYYHNEITNISARHSALMSASNPRDPDLLKLVIADLLKTERNGILTKTQTTAEIARARAEAESSKDLVSVITKLMESFGRASARTEEK